MFSSDSPNIFVQHLGNDFAQSVVKGLRDRFEAHPPETIAKATLIVNTARMARRIRDLFAEGPPAFLPKILLLSQIDTLLDDMDITPARHPLQRRLQLAELIGPVVKQKPELAARASVFSLADSLATLMDEMQGEGVSPEAIGQLDVSDQSGHWQNAQALILIAHTYVSEISSGLDPEARQRLVVKRLIAQWAQKPPESPIILAGSTGSRGATAMLMETLARLENGALILPGFDPFMSDSVWTAMTSGHGFEDHPQYRFARLFDALKIPASCAKLWDTTATSTTQDRNKVVSLALRPAPVTDAWLKEGEDLPDLTEALANVTLLEAPSQRIEALSIALRLRQAAEDGQKAALITPDRMLSRQVGAALDRWDISPDDSGGAPLHLSPPGRFLRHTADLLNGDLNAEHLLILLKHPLTQTGALNAKHGLYTQNLELLLRRHMALINTPEALQKVLDKLVKDDDTKDWAAWLIRTFFPRTPSKEMHLKDWLTLHRSVSERIAGDDDNPGKLWLENAGRAAALSVEELEQNADFGGEMSAAEFSQLVTSVLSQGEVRDRDEPHPDIMIWGTLEARVQGADLVIIGGLNDGVWPEAAIADPWLNRTLRHQAGLLLPDRKIGLSAHDFQQAMGAQEVWMTRSIRSDDSETVASRWLNRLTNLIGGLPTRNGPQALGEMRMKGQIWLSFAQTLETVSPVAPMGRAAPMPPVNARPRDFSVTEIKTLIRDPYAIYAKHCLKLRRLDPLVQEPDAPVRGIVIHEIMHQFIKSAAVDLSTLNSENLMAIADQVMSEQVPWPTARAMWRARLSRVADWIVDTERLRQARGTPVIAEETAQGVMALPEIGGSIRARADRIDLTENGEAIIYDYKSGAPPGKQEQKIFDKQLLIEAAMVENGAFKSIGTHPVKDAIYISLGSDPKEFASPLGDESPQVIREGLVELLAAYLRPDQPYLSRRMLQSDGHRGDYEQLARFGEWEDGDLARPEDLS